MEIPKDWITALRIPDYYPMVGGELAHPCQCGEPIDFDMDDTSLIQWDDGRMMLVHDHCVEVDPDA